MSSRINRTIRRNKRRRQENIIEEFINWFHSRGEFYAKLPVKFYMDGEPYFSSQGVECTLRNYLRIRDEIKKEKL